jgi:uncharacterized membrane protein
VNGGIRGYDLLPGSIEYPVLIGLFAWITARLAWSPDSYILISAPFLGALALLVSYLLARMAGWRAMLWVGAPALGLYAFHNWDLLAVAPAVGGLWCWWRGRSTWAAVLFGVGAAAKLYPGIFLVPLALESWFSNDRRGAAARFGIGAGTALLINLPFLLANPSGWFATYEFHRLSPPNMDTIWGLKFSWSFAERSWPLGLVNLLSAGLTLTSFLVVLAFGWRRATRDGVYPLLQVSGALLGALLFWHTVHSPQYLLWVLPFFVLLRVSVFWWAAYAVIDCLLYLSVFYLGPKGLASPYLQAAVYGRAALLLALAVTFLRAEAFVRTYSSRLASVVSGYAVSES